MAAPHHYTPHPNDWDHGDSLVLLFAIAAGASCGQVAAVLGRTRDSCLGRMRRLKALDRRLTQQAETLQRNTSNRG